MCGLAQSTFLMVPLNFTGLFTSNSAEIEWCAATGTATATAATTRAQTVRFMMSSRSVYVLWPLPRRNRAREEILEIVLFAGVFHQDVRRGLEPPGPDIHPIPSVRPRVVHRHSVLDRVGVRPAEGVRQLQLLAVGMAGGIQLRVAVEIRRLDDQRVAVPASFRHPV